MIVIIVLLYKKSLIQQDIENERLFANIGLLLFKKIVPEVIEGLLGKVQLDLFIKETCYDIDMISCIAKGISLPRCQKKRVHKILQCMFCHTLKFVYRKS